MAKDLHAVTGAFGYSGKYMARRLLESGCRVITLTNSPDRQNPFGGRLKAYPFHFDEPEKLTENLKDVLVLYNTYWVRFNHKNFTHAKAVENTRRLFAAAAAAGVERIVHVSITNPAENSDLEYFRGKAVIEAMLKASGLSHAILRPTVLFGKEDILINNIAWLLRRFSIFGVFGDGQYKIQPIHVDDLARLAVEQGRRRNNVTIDAIGPETFTYRDLVKEIGRIIGKKRAIVSIPPAVGWLMGYIPGKLLGDVVITREEIKGLMRNLLYVDAPPAGKTRLTEWAERNRSSLGTRYASELARRTRTAVYYHD